MNTAEYPQNQNNTQNQNSNSQQHGFFTVPVFYPIYINVIPTQANQMDPNNMNDDTSTNNTQNPSGFENNTQHNTPLNNGNNYGYFFHSSGPTQFVFNNVMNGMPSQMMDENAYFDYMTRIAEQLSMQDQKKMAPSASEHARENLPIITVEQIPSDYKSCPVCLDDFSTSTDLQIRQMPCKHVFHQDCLFPWLKTTNSCPQCRFPLMTDNSEYNDKVSDEISSRYRNSPNHFHSTTPCGLLPSGLCCSSTDDRMLSLSACNHTFHSQCLKSSHLSSGGVIDDFITQVKCPSCRKYSSLSSSLIQ